jgi:hypothetical protein
LYYNNSTRSCGHYRNLWLPRCTPAIRERNKGRGGFSLEIKGSRNGTNLEKNHTKGELISVFYLADVQIYSALEKNLQNPSYTVKNETLNLEKRRKYYLQRRILADRYSYLIYFFYE